MAHFITLTGDISSTSGPARPLATFLPAGHAIANGSSTPGCVVDDDQTTAGMADNWQNTAGLVALPTIEALVADALNADFHDRLHPYGPVENAAAAAASVAIEDWCHDNHAPISAVPYEIWHGLIVALVREAQAEITRCIDEEYHGWIDLVEGMAGGDLDADGNWVPYPKSYFGSVA